MIEGKIVKGLIVVRSGSKRVQNKNSRPFANTTLLENKILQLKRIKELDGILVNSDDSAMLTTAEMLGCETFKRDNYYASDLATANETYRYFASNIETDIVVFANATSPLIKDETIRLMIHKYFEKQDDFDSVNSANYIKKFMFKDGISLNWDVDKQPRSQDLPDILALNFAVNVIERKLMVERKSILGRKPLLVPINEVEAIDIDTEYDFALAESIYEKGYEF